MFKRAREKIASREKLLFAIIPLVAVLVVFINFILLKSFLIGTLATCLSMIVNAQILGRIFFRDERPFFRLGFGLFAFTILMAVMGILALFVSLAEIWTVFGMFFATLVTLILNLFTLKHNRSLRKTNEEDKRVLAGGRYLILIRIFYIASLLLCFLILFSVRSGWVRGPIWNVVPSNFLPLYLVSTAILAAIVFLPGETRIKLLLISLHSIFSLLFVVIILHPGIIFYDPWYEWGRTRSLLDYARIVSRWTLSIRLLNNFVRGLSAHVLISIFTDAFYVDMYWSYVFLLPMMWGFFVPLTSYRIAEMISKCRRTATLAAFLTIPNIFFLAWGKLTEATSLGVLFYVFFYYLLFRYLYRERSSIKVFFLLVITFVATAAAHILPVMLCISSIVLAFALKKHGYFKRHLKSGAYFVLFISFAISTLLLPFVVNLRGVLLPMLGTSAFSVDKFLNTDIWRLVFGFSAGITVQRAMLYHVFALLGIVGLVYALQREAKFDRTLCFFSLLLLGVFLLDYRILEYGMKGQLFGPGRIKVFRDIIALPFAAIVLKPALESLTGKASKMKSLFKWKRVLAGTLVFCCLASWVTAAIYETYEYYTVGLLPTSLELEAIEYIDEHTNSRYIVWAPQPTAVISWGVIGTHNPEKRYFYLGRGNPKYPSTAHMFEYMQIVGADVGYLIASSFRSEDFKKSVAEASEIFGLFKVFTNEKGQIYIFDYKIAPLPLGPDVEVFYWDTPPSYNIQNDLMRVTINLVTQSIDVRDFWGTLYESLRINETVVGGNQIGQITSLRYFNSTSSEWVVWGQQTEISPTERFQFKLDFESTSLVGVVERENPAVELRWEDEQAFTLSSEVGGFTHLYIPGLVGGKDSYDTNSREYGLLYTESLTEGVTLSPRYKPETDNTSLTYAEISRYCGFNLTPSHMWYDVYVNNNADMDQWAYIEVWLPDKVYTGTFPPLRYSIDDGKSWVYAPYNVTLGGSQPIKTMEGVEVNWIFTAQRSQKETPTKWWSHTKAYGDPITLPSSYTDSGGAQNRIIFGFYLPAGDKILVRLGSSVYYARPLEVSYVFRDSENTYYGLRNMQDDLIKFYDVGSSKYVGGLTSTRTPTSLVITQDEANEINSLRVTFPAATVFSLYSAKDVDTGLDIDQDGIPDFVEG